MNRNRIIPAAISMICLSASCTNSSHLLVYQHSNLGLNTGINPANQSVHVRIGVRNEVVAIVPKYVIPPKGTEVEKKFEAASAYFGTRFRINSIWEVPEAAEVLATGNAAVLAASKGRLRLTKGHDDAPATNPSNTATGQAAATDQNSVSPTDSGNTTVQN